MIPNCPKLKGGEKGGSNSNNGDKGKGSNVNPVGSGLFLSVGLYGQQVNCLIDTGAALTVISTAVWNNSELANH